VICTPPTAGRCAPQPGRPTATSARRDLAAIESTKPDGTRVSGRYDNQGYFALYDGYASDVGHLNAVGSKIAAVASSTPSPRRPGGSTDVRRAGIDIVSVVRVLCTVSGCRFWSRVPGVPPAPRCRVVAGASSVRQALV
jgi:hypothetical protein